MADNLSPEHRSLCMSKIRSRDTKPELIVRKIAHNLGYRFRLHRTDLPGKPDIVFPGRMKIILVHGCFWHKHRCRFGNPVPSTNPEYWKQKHAGNVKRDKRTRRELRLGGWMVLVVWECQTRPEKREWLVNRIDSFLSSHQASLGVRVCNRKGRPGNNIVRC